MATPALVLPNDNDNNDDNIKNSEEIGDDTDGIDLSDLAGGNHLLSAEDGDGDDAGETGTDDDDDDDDDDLCAMIQNVSSNDSTVPVGITIAYKRFVAADDTAEERMLVSSRKTDRTRTIDTGTSTGTERKKKRRMKQQQPSKAKRDLNNNSNNNSEKKSKWSVHKSLQVFLESSAIYIFCIIIPPFIAYVYHNIIQEITWDTIKSIVLLSSSHDTPTSASDTVTTSTTNTSTSTGTGSSNRLTSLLSSYVYYFLPVNSIIERWSDYESYQYVKSTIYEPTINYMCTPTANYDSESGSGSTYSYYTSYVWSSMLEQTGICPPEYLLQQQQLRRRRSIISDDMSMYMDVFYIAICSFLLAVVRMMIVHYTIFKNSGTKNVASRTSDTTGSNNDNSMALSNVETLTILVRCKSNHLLSSDYHNIPATPDHSTHQRRIAGSASVNDYDVISSQITLPNLLDDKRLPSRDTFDNVSIQDDTAAAAATVDSSKDNNNVDDTNEMFGFQIDISERDRQQEHGEYYDESHDLRSEDNPVVRMNPLAVGISSTTSIYNDNNSTNQSGGNNAFDFESPDHSNDTSRKIRNIQSSMTMRRDNTTSSSNDVQRQELEEETTRQQRREQRKLIVAAPRYATAIFRLLYCTITAGIALLYFRHADFWPWFVFGTGRGTKQCWDLSGGLTVGGMDSDFDQHNAVLKRYFLWQASYHIHSTTFHFLISMLFLFNPFVTTSSSVTTTGNDPIPASPSMSSSPSKRLRGIKRGSHAYIRSFIQHLLSVVLIAVAYIFSSLRRLGAIGLFAFDVSSWSLHLLQICINAPDDSRLWSMLPQRYRNKKEKRAVIRGLYLYLVIPSFVITRFMIWPALWYSAAYESQSWLQQLEMTLWPGSALLLRCIIHTLMIVLHGISLLYLHRLLSYRLISK